MCLLPAAAARILRSEGKCHGKNQLLGELPGGRSLLSVPYVAQWYGPKILEDRVARILSSVVKIESCTTVDQISRGVDHCHSIFTLPETRWAQHHKVVRFVLDGRNSGLRASILECFERILLRRAVLLPGKKYPDGCRFNSC